MTGCPTVNGNQSPHNSLNYLYHTFNKKQLSQREDIFSLGELFFVKGMIQIIQGIMWTLIAIDSWATSHAVTKIQLGICEVMVYGKT